ncbi:hypothetical protein [Burkholderia cenocepacia]|uniref:hypothetical protein n=1 Tax=Burkholderia cenocepacia TaxID=95486 RepID=UPI002B24AC14|nr:hypothetical protein [Burkholderia cenocepacia]MEB2558815.1 hypothetical protein [Burkholderia cenocepacia]
MKFLRRWFSISMYLSIGLVPIAVAGCALLKGLPVLWADRPWITVIVYPAAGAACVAVQVGLAAAILIWSVESDTQFSKRNLERAKGIEPSS